MKRQLFLAAFFSLTVAAVSAQPSTPEPGKRWVIERSTSDEFESGEFDDEKWFNTNPRSWRGRFPGLFKSEAMWMSDGKLHLTVDQFAEPVEFKGQMWTHQGAHIQSKATLLPGVFVECSMKANKTFMSSTFWLINRRSDGEGCDRRVIELDIQECIGYPFDNPKSTQMGSNTHSRGIEEGCDIPTGSKGNHCEVSGKVYDDFHIYGAWWKSPSEILFYLDGEYQYTINPVAPFDLPMEVKLVCETYDWSKVPEDGGMTGTLEERTTSYDWVRCYNLIPVSKKQNKADEAANKIFDESVMFAENGAESLSSKQPEIGVIYSSSRGGKLSFELKNSEGKSVATSKVTLYSGVGNVALKLKSDKLPAGEYQASVKFGKEEHTETFTVK